MNEETNQKEVDMSSLDILRCGLPYMPSFSLWKAKQEFDAINAQHEYNMRPDVIEREVEILLTEHKIRTLEKRKKFLGIF